MPRTMKFESFMYIYIYKHIPGSQPPLKEWCFLGDDKPLLKKWWFGNQPMKIGVGLPGINESPTKTRPLIPL